MFLIRCCLFSIVLLGLCSCTIKIPVPGGVVVSKPGHSQQVIYPGDAN